jgi:hypothetical protein
MIGILADKDMRQQAGTGQAARDRSIRCRRLHDLIAARTGQLGAYLADDLERGRNILQELGDVFTQRLECTATSRAGGLFRGVRLGLAREVHRQRTPDGMLCRLGLRRHVRQGLGLGTAQLIQHELELPEFLVEPLRAAANARPAQDRDLQLQLGDARLNASS